MLPVLPSRRRIYHTLEIKVEHPCSLPEIGSNYSQYESAYGRFRQKYSGKYTCVVVRDFKQELGGPFVGCFTTFQSQLNINREGNTIHYPKRKKNLFGFCRDTQPGSLQRGYHSCASCILFTNPRIHKKKHYTFITVRSVFAVTAEQWHGR